MALIVGDTYGSGTEAVRVDTDGQLIAIDHAHDAIHQGGMFSATYSWTNVASATSKYLNIDTSGNVNVHMAIRVSSTDVTFVEFYEDRSDSSGNALTAYNRDRNSAVAATIAVVYDPTSIDTSGNLLFSEYIAAGHKSGGCSRSEDEFILAPNKQYSLKITSGADGDDFAAQLMWYEV